MYSNYRIKVAGDFAQRKVSPRNKYSRQYYLRHRDKVLERSKKWKIEHAEINNAYIKAWRDELFETWGKLPINERQKMGFEAEVVGEKVLQQKGFKTIRTNRAFPVDILAEKGGKFAVEVSIYPRKKFQKYLWKYLDFFELRLLCLFIRPNFKEYFLIEVPRNQRTIAVPKEIVLCGGDKIQ